MPDHADDPSSLSLLAAHFAGDWPLQSNAMAAEKLDDAGVRAKHVTVYTAAFLPIVFLSDWDNRQAAVFLTGLWGSHFIIDSRRWAEPVDGFESRPIWFDQVYHVIALAVIASITKALGSSSAE